MRPCRRTTCAALVAGCVAGLLVASAGVGLAQTGRLPGERFAPVLVPADAPALDVESITVEPADGSDVTFVVGFREGFASPSDGYRVAVSVGDPTGKRTRWTLAVFGGQVSGTVETGDGTVWDPVGPTVAELDASGGRATIVAQPSGVPADSALWVDTELPTPVGPLGAATAYFSYDGLAAASSDGLAPGATAVPTSGWGWLRDPEGLRVEGAVRVPGAPPTATWANRALVISTPDAPPSLLQGQPVTATADLVRIVGTGDAGPREVGYLLVNRVTGEVQLFVITDGSAIEVPDVVATVVPSAAPGAAPSPEPPSTRAVSIDVAALTEALGLPDDPSAVAVVVDRASTLADGSVVTTSGVAATLASLEPAEAAGAEPAPVAEDVVVPVDDADDGLPVVAILIAGGVALLAIVGVVVALVSSRRRRRHRSLLAEGWLDRELTLRTPPGAAPAPPPTFEPSAAAVPPVLDLDALEKEPAETGRAAGNGNGHHEPGSEPAPAEGPSADAARATQEQALADLEAQFADLIERVDRLGSHDNGAS